MSMVRPTVAEIDLSIIKDNTRHLAKVAGVGLWAVVKADAYGHGAIEVATTLAPLDCVRGLAVSLVEEAVELRNAGVDAPILVMGPSLHGGYEDIVHHRLTAVVSQIKSLDALLAVASNAHLPVSVQIKVDSGMNRLGLRGDEIEIALRRKGLDLSGVMTHLACADEDDPNDADCKTHRQLIRFATTIARVRRRTRGKFETHAAATSALIKFPGSRLSVVRPGIGLYGNGLACQIPGVASAMSLRTQIAQVRQVAAGETVSYGAEWRAPRDSVIAVLPLGYADGFPRSMGSGGQAQRASALCRGRRVPVIGRVCMDMVMIDITADSTNTNDTNDATNIDDRLATGDRRGLACEGDEVVLLGRQGDEQILVSEFAHLANLSEYEVTCGISKRVPRKFR